MTDLAPVQVPVQSIQKATLSRLVEEFVTRDGTDYGSHEIPTEKKVSRAMAALHAGKAIIVFDPNTGSVTIVDTDTFEKRLK